jgi:hypothetical protein
MSETQLNQAAGNPVSASNGQRKARKARTIVRRYPATVNYGITQAMALSIMRLCPPGGPFSQSQYLRMILHERLAATDPNYMREPDGRVQG